MNITKKVWAYVLGHSITNKKAKKVLDKLNYDICEFVLDNNSILIEAYHNITIPNYVYDYIKKEQTNIIDFCDWLDKQ